MVKIRKDIFDQGERRAVAGNKPLLLTDDSYCWLVKEGSVDLFLVDTDEEEELCGQRSYLFSLEENDTLFGVQPIIKDLEYSLLVAGKPGTVLVRIGLEHWKGLISSQPALLESACNWVEKFSEVSGQKALDLEVQNENIIEDLKQFNASSLELAIQEREDQLGLQRDQYHLRRKREDKFIDNSLREILQVVEEETAAAGLEQGDPLFNACQVICGHLKIEIKHPSKKKGETKLQDIADSSRFKYRQVLLDGEWWRADAGPLLAFRGEEHQPVALIPKKPNTYYLYDPERGEELLVTPAVAEELNPNAVTFYRPFPERALSLLDLVKFGRESFWLRDIFLLIFTGTIGGLLGLSIPLATRNIFDVIIPEGEGGQIWQLALLLFAAVLAKSLFELTRSFAFVRLRTSIDYSLQSAVWDRLLTLPVPFFRNYTAGELAQKAMSINEIKNIMSDAIMTSLLAGIFSIFFYLQMFYFSIPLALGATVLVIISLLVTLFLGMLKIRYQQELLEIKNEISGFVLQLINGISKIRVSASENRFFHLWSREFSKQRRLDLKVYSFNNYLSTFNAFFPVISSLIIFYLVIGQRTEINAGIFIAFNAAFISFQTSILSLSDVFINMLASKPMLKNVEPILKTVPEYHDEKESPGELSGQIEVSNLDFRYTQDGPLIIKNLSLNIKPGEYVAFVGPSGSGKSTLLRLLLGFEKPQFGCIYYDNHDLEKIDIKEVRKQLGIVLQDGQLMSGSLYSNIIGSSTELTLDDAWEAARMAGLAEDIKKMPMGMHTVVSQGQQTLSGGQKQRLLIARAVVRKPKLIYFDEATSALDNKSQSLVTDSLNRLNATRIVIAHRLSTIRECDRIFVLEEGELIEEGNYRQLMNQEGVFSELARRQLA